LTDIPAALVFAEALIALQLILSILTAQQPDHNSRNCGDNGPANQLGGQLGHKPIGFATVRDLFRLLAYVVGLAIVVRGTSPGDRSTVLKAYDRKRFNVTPRARP
jgi:hypothetical protein